MTLLVTFLLACDGEPAAAPAPEPAAAPTPAAAPVLVAAGLYHTRVTPFDPNAVEGLPSGAACWGEVNGQTVIHDDLSNLWVGIDGEVVKIDRVNIVGETIRFFALKGLDIGLYEASGAHWLQEQAEGSEKVMLDWKCGS